MLIRCLIIRNIKIYNTGLYLTISRCISSTFPTAKEKGYVVKELDTGYKPHQVEKNKYDLWEKENRFVYKPSSDKNKTFSVILPPPNVTGNLHLGHALTTTLIDVLARWKRMNGYDVLFLPGTDHAGIATQVVVEKYLKKRGKNKNDMTKNEFNKEMWKWKQEHADNIRQQLKTLGASLDWTREVFTMDEKQLELVKKVFLQLYKEGLIYRDSKLINWSCALRSTISDMEVDNVNISGPTYVKVPGYSDPIQFGYLTTVAYEIDESNEEIFVSTTRLETMLGDEAIAVHPSDARYKHLLSKHAKHPLIDGKTIPIIADDCVDPDFGTGAVKVSPAHDNTDREIARRFNLVVKSVIDEEGNICNNSKYAGMPRYKARKVIMEDLTSMNLIRDHVGHEMVLPICSRSGDVVELLPKKQWFLNCRDLVDAIDDLTNSGELDIVPNNHKIVWFDRLLEHKDWCLSRQLWWGHSIPMWWIQPENEPDRGQWITADNENDAQNTATKLYPDENPSSIIHQQDADVLDTWFSSGVYPFTTVGWPKDSEYKQLYPLSILVTGYDIMCLWVMRMAMLGKQTTGQLPFPKVLLHGIVTDAQGAKMSKSKGNVIDPQDIINGATLQELNDKSNKLYEMGTLSKHELKLALEGHKKCYPQGIPECGADALRFTLCEVNPLNQLISFNLTKCYTNKLFGNKIWQSVKYYKNCHDVAITRGFLDKCKKNNLQSIDLWLLSRLSHLVNIVNGSLEEYKFHIAVDALKSFLYNEMCDAYIECTKLALKSDANDNENSIKLAAHCHTFNACFNTALRCLSPFMPYLMEELISALPQLENVIINYDDSIDSLKYPEINYFASWRDLNLERKMDTVLNVISIIRDLRHTFNIEYKKTQPDIIIKCSDNQTQIRETMDELGHLIMYITKCNSISIEDDGNSDSGLGVWSYCHRDRCKIFMKLPENEEMVEKIRVSRDKLVKRKEKLMKNLKRLEMIVNGEGYDGSPEEVKKEHSTKIKEIKDDLEKIEYLYNNF